MSFDTVNDFLLVAKMNGGRTAGDRRAIPPLDALIVMLANAGCINLVVSGTAPVTGQDNTVWLNPNANPFSANGALSAWDGAAYVPMTPDLFSRLVYGRRRLTAATTFYVNGTTGSDTLGDGTLAKPFQTIARAGAFVRDRIDTSSFNVTIQVADGSYAAGLNIPQRVGGGNLIVTGNTATPANCVVTATQGFNALFGSVVATVSGFKIVASNFAVLNSAPGVTINVSNLEFGACGNALYAVNASLININSDMAVSGNIGGAVMAADMNALMTLTSRAFTFTNNPSMGSAFAAAYRGGRLNIAGYTSVNGGTVTGKRFDITQVGHINTNAGGANYFPGSIAGFVDATSVYG